MPWSILHRFHLSLPLTVSVQGNFISEHSNNMKGERNMGCIIIQSQTVFLCTVKQEGGLLGV